MNDTSAADDLPLEELRDIAEVPAVEIITSACIHLMSAAAVKCGLGIGTDSEIAAEQDLDEARNSSTPGRPGHHVGPDLGTFHAARCGTDSPLCSAPSPEASDIPDAPGQGPGEQFTGPVIDTQARGDRKAALRPPGSVLRRFHTDGQPTAETASGPGPRTAGMPVQ